MAVGRDPNSADGCVPKLDQGFALGYRQGDRRFGPNGSGQPSALGDPPFHVAGDSVRVVDIFTNNADG
jgi:hypothetical protein